MMDDRWLIKNQVFLEWQTSNKPILGAEGKPFFFVIAGPVLGAALMALFSARQAFFQSWLMDDPGRLFARAGMILALLVLMMAASLLAIAAWIYVFGCRVVREERFPPASAPVFRDTEILEGPAARHRGRLIQGIAIVLVVLAFALLWMAWRVWAVFRMSTFIAGI